MRTKRERWRRIERVWDEALERPPGERDAFLDEACAGDAALRREAASLLAAGDECGGFMEEPALRHAAALLARRGRHR